MAKRSVQKLPQARVHRSIILGGGDGGRVGLVGVRRGLVVLHRVGLVAEHGGVQLGGDFLLGHAHWHVGRGSGAGLLRGWLIERTRGGDGGYDVLRDIVFAVSAAAAAVSRARCLFWEAALQPFR